MDKKYGLLYSLKIMRKELYYLAVVVSALLLVTFFVFTNSQKPTSPTENNLSVSPEVTQEEMRKPTKSVSKTKQWNSPPAMDIDTAKSYSAVLMTTKGEIAIALEADATPVTVNNFVFLARQNFYDNVIFHRIIKGFMIQSGDPEGTGRGGPGYRFDDETFSGEYTRGTVAMANAGPDTNGSQFFIMHGDTPLQKDYVIFGHVTAGMDVVDAIANGKVTSGFSGEASTPVNPDKILSVTIREE